jgi:hypothetical protein
MTQRERVWWPVLLLAALAVLLAAMALAGCGRAQFAAGSTPDVQAAIAKAGSRVLDQGTAKNYYPGGKDARWYVLAQKGSTEPAAVVSVLTFDSQQARDAAARDLDNSRRSGSRREGVYTYGDAVVLINRITDKATARLLDQVLRGAGMK